MASYNSIKCIPNMNQANTGRKVLLFSGLINLVIIYSALTVSSTKAKSDKWDENVRPKLVFDFLNKESSLANTADSEDPNQSHVIRRFLGNHTHTDYFKLLRKDGNSLLIGARNIVYNISLPTLEENIDQRITWDPKHQDQELCLLKGKQEVDCQNYIRVLVQLDSRHPEGKEELLVCGTNAYNPMCRHYLTDVSTNNNKKNDRSLVQKEFSGRGFCPYDPRHNSTSIYADGELYAGTVADFSATDALIIKKRLRTEQYDLKHLNEPHFVSSLEDDKHVYFFFRESAVEFMNCGKAIFSRVARVCKSDQGGPRKFRDNWTTFLKSRLNCSVPGEHPFYFDQIQATSGLVDGHLIYGVFTTPDNAISGSAICAFSLKDITESLEHGPFKGQSALNSNWLPMSKAETPEPRPGSCNAKTTEEGMNFVKRHTLVDRAVPSAHNMPLFIKTSLGERLTVIAVDSGVPGVQDSGLNTHHDVIFVGTTRGRVLKLVNSARHGSDMEPLPVLVEALQVFPYDVPVKNLLVVRESDQLIVLSEQEVAALSLHRCQAANKSCGDCVALQDPYCAWDIKTNSCQAYRPGQKEQLQNVNIGYHPQCPVPIEPTTTTTTTTTTTAPTTIEKISTTLTEGKNRQNAASNVNEEITTVNDDFETATELLNEGSAACPSCTCECGATDLSSSEMGTNFKAPNAKAEEKFVDLLDIYNQNQSDLDNGIFNDVPFLEVRNSLGVVKRQEKELNNFYEDDEDFEEDGLEVLEQGPKVFATEADYHEFDGYSEEVLALAIVMTAFVALVIGLCLGIFVTRQCTTTTSSAANHLHHATQASPVKEKRINGSTKSKSGNSNNGTNDIHNYSVTTISTNCNESNKSHSVDSSFKQISAYETNGNTGFNTGPVSLPPQFHSSSSRHSIASTSSQPLSLNPVHLENQRPLMESFKSPSKSMVSNNNTNALVSLPAMSAPAAAGGGQRPSETLQQLQHMASERPASRCSSVQQKVKRVYI